MCFIAPDLTKPLSFTSVYTAHAPYLTLTPNMTNLHAYCSQIPVVLSLSLFSC